MLTHGCPRGAGREDGRRILMLPKLPMIYTPPKAKLYSSLSRTTQIQSCILSLKSPRLTKSPRLPNGLISRVNGKAQREPRLLKANKKSLMEISFPKENTLESFLGYSQFKVVKQVCPWGKDLMPGTPRRKLSTSPHTPHVQPLEECACVHMRVCVACVCVWGGVVVG